MPRSFDKVETYAIQQQSSSLARAANRASNPYAGLSGVRLISAGDEALAARLVLA